jgi:serpin B
MNRRTFMALLTSPAVAALITACGDDASTPTSTPGPTLLPVRSARSDLARSAATLGDAQQAAAAINAFATDLYDRLVADDPQANLVFSPTSIALALLMTLAGARGTTAEEMITTLHVTDAEAIHRSANAVDAAVDESSSGLNRVTITNSLWGQDGFAFEQPFLDVLASEYGTGMELVDYRADAEGARVAINGWVSNETDERIPELLAPGTLTPVTRLTLVNAVYLKAKWQFEFTEEATLVAPFTTATGATVDVPTMHQTSPLAYAEAPGWRAVQLPYVDGLLAMDIYLPDVATAGSVPFGDLAEALLTETLTPTVQLSLPKFDIETSTSLAEQLAALGMPTAFSDSADFTGISTVEPLHIADVIHQANITVDEEGTEAAAATGVVIRSTSAPVDTPIEFVVDRPFVFALRHVSTGATLFMGRVTDPSQTRS